MRIPPFALVLLVLLSPLISCSLSPDASAAEVRAGASAREGEPRNWGTDSSTVVAECVTEKYPCSWAEVPEALRAQTYRIGALVANHLATADSIAQVVELLEMTAQITDVASGELGVRFRIVGARPIFVALPNDSANPRLSSPIIPASDKRHVLTVRSGVTGTVPATRRWREQQ